MGLGSNLVQLGFVTYCAVVAFNLYHLFVPTRCGDGTPRHLCVPPALAGGDKFDLWVYASPKKHFHSVEKFITSDAHDPEVRYTLVHLISLGLNKRCVDGVEVLFALRCKLVLPFFFFSPLRPLPFARQRRRPTALLPVPSSHPRDWSQVGNATVRLMYSTFGIELGAGHEARVPIPTAQFGTRANGTLYAHVLVYRSTKKSLTEGLSHPKVGPLLTGGPTRECDVRQRQVVYNLHVQ